MSSGLCQRNFQPPIALRRGLSTSLFRRAMSRKQDKQDGQDEQGRRIANLDSTGGNQRLEPYGGWHTRLRIVGLVEEAEGIRESRNARLTSGTKRLHWD